LFSEKSHRYIFLFGLCALAFGMMVGTVPTSVPQIILMANWLLEGDFKRKWSQLKANKLFWVLSSVFLIHLLGLSYTQNFGDGIKDVKTKMPLMFLPMLFFSSRPLSLKEFYGVLYCFIAGCVVNTLWCLLYSFVLHHNEVVRNASRFMSHIRLGLYLNVGIAACIYFSVKSGSLLKKSGWIFISLYFIFVLYTLGLASGLMNFVILFLLTLCVFISKQKVLIQVMGLLVLAGFIALVSGYILSVANAQLTVKQTKNNQLMKFSPSGKPYIHFDTSGQKENGNYIQINIQLQELQKEWNAQFPEDTFSYSPQHNMQRYEILLRYLASKGLNKDSAGISKLGNEDKINIQKNISNYEYPGWSYLHQRTYELVNEYDEFKNDRFINGHSLTMRLYFWKAALHIIKRNFVFGVGTGDVQDALNKTYVETRSPLHQEWFKRPHNQFLTMMVALGIIGLLIFLVSIIYPLVILKGVLPKLFWPFFIIAIISFFLEDTLETQAGLSFYAFFNSLFISIGWNKKHFG
jgi:hypothetical protein